MWFTIPYLLSNISLGVVLHDCFEDSTYVGREVMTVEYLWKEYIVDHWVKGPHHFWVDVASGFIVRGWQPWYEIFLFQELRIFEFQSFRRKS